MEDLLRGLTSWREARSRLSKKERQSIYKNQRSFVVLQGDAEQIEPLTALSQAMIAAGLLKPTEARLLRLGARCVSLGDPGFDDLSKRWEDRVRQEGTTPSRRLVDQNWRPPKFFVLSQ